MPEYDPPLNAFFASIPVPGYINGEKFIGHGGYHLKRITELSRTDYIWFRFETHTIEIWSFKERYIPKAIRMLTKRIQSLMPEPGEITTYVAPGGKAVVETWNAYPRKVEYVITGEESACLKTFEEVRVRLQKRAKPARDQPFAKASRPHLQILREYPHNPYFTRMKSKTTNDQGATRD